MEDHHSCTIEYLTGARPTPTETESLANDSRTSYVNKRRPHLPLIPTIEFCKEVIDSDGKLSIHSGTEPEIIGTILDHEGVSDLFDVIVSSNKTNKTDGGYARYKSNACSPG